MQLEKTRDLCTRAYLSGDLTFIDCPHGEGPVCCIGDWWFYFADNAGSYPDAFAYLRDVGYKAALEQVASYLSGEMGDLFPDEVGYYLDVLRDIPAETLPGNDGRHLPGRGHATRYVNDVACDAALFSFDGCHKIYVIDSPSGLANELELDGNLFPIDMLPQAWALSCPLRFISHADLRLPDLVAQGESALFEGFPMTPRIRAEVESINRAMTELAAEIEAEAEDDAV